ncbi:adenosylcobinamide-phosphate synthase CbiB [Herbivorax sp. ANBcel31]|uniref:adenosylcobinamide-phosphate synthase CbiB n=1 Tax=Herbivorax sp. ANBcel31 TaxID=3069754 RepID=UPI0027B1FE09|nr:adenosylcobinamide-phosphate synthase CbiB [Herbivorax sp. ANBcel31]MDQ2085509.1 adenosylcobinamide-phosphate synthase CbiB [Herbivorax sp. ANBcel31]
MSLYLLLEISIAFILDILLGDPRWLPHPVRFIGWFVKLVEKLVRNIANASSERKVKALGDDIVRNSKKKNRNEKFAGVVLAVFVVAFVFIAVYAIVRVASGVSPILSSVVNIYFIYSAFAAKGLAAESFKVFDALKERDIFGARKVLSTIVGRQTENLDEKEVIKGAVETTAENTSDAVVAPIFYTFIGSFFGLAAPFVYAFKAISTLDSMVGYKNDQYENFGWASAKLDDILNFIPARLTGLLIVVSAFINQKDYSASYTIMRRDRRKHFSPNSGYPESAVAGALGVRLGGSGLYFGDIVEKPIIGDPVNELNIRNITQAITLMYITSILSLVSLSLIYIAVYFIKGFFA